MENDPDRGSVHRPSIETGTRPAVVLFVTGGLVAAALAVALLQGSAASVAGVAQVAVTADCDVGERFPEPGEPVFIDASDSENADQYRYDRNGDGSYDTGWINDSSYTFSYEQGTYTPQVAVRNTSQDTGNVDTTQCPTLEVAPNEAPTANATHSPESPQVGETVTIDARGSSDPDGNVSYYQFDFGADGTYEIQENTTGLAARTYNTTGTKQVRVRVVDNDGAADTVLVEFTVTENQPPEASFTITPSPTVVAGENTTLNASASRDPDGTIAYYLWDFDGDGTVDRNTTKAVITHQFAYDGGGGRVVRLTVVDDDGATDFASTDIGVIAEPTVRCSVSPRTITPGGDVTVDVSDSTHADTFQYDFDGDGTYDTDRLTVEVTNTSEYGTTFYPDTGTYTPRVRAYNSSSDTTVATDCPSVTVQEGNTPPTASFSVSPEPVIAGQNATLDASGSSDPDGSIAYYLWDFDGDGTVDRNTTKAVISRPFPYNTTGEGYAVVELTVVDNEGAVASTTNDVEIIRQEVTARCSVSPAETTVGDEVTINASASSNAETYRYDVDGDREFDTERLGESSLTRPYEEARVYTPHVRVFGPDGEQTDTAPCGEVVVREGNDPPIPALDHGPDEPAPGETVRLNASRSIDTDGRIVTYRWDLDNDGTFERNTTRPVITHQFDSTGNHTVGLQVIDDDGAAARTTLLVRVESGGPSFPWWILAALLGGGGGYIACRGRDLVPNVDVFGGGGSSEGGITAFASGTFETPTASETVTVSGLGFEPDVLRFRVTNAATASEPGASSGATGWSYGLAVRTEEGVDQQVVSVADVADTTPRMAGAVNDGKAIDVLVHGADSVGSVAGIATPTDDGFEVAFSTETVPSSAEQERYVVLFDAMATASGASVDVGHVATPTEPGTQTVDLDVDADHVSLTATTLPDSMNAAGTTDRSIGFSTGRASRHGTSASSITQTAAGYVGSASLGWPEAAGVFDDRAVTLGYADAEGIAGRTHARVTGLGEQLELSYDAVHAPDTAEEGWAVPAIVTYLAIDTGGRPPTTGVVRPRADDAVTTVDLGFHPNRVELATFEHAGYGTEELRPPGAAGFDWSESTVVVDEDGTVSAHLLHASVDDGLPLVDALAPTPPQSEGTADPAAIRGSTPPVGLQDTPTDGLRELDTAGSGPDGQSGPGEQGEPAGEEAPGPETISGEGVDAGTVPVDSEALDGADVPEQVRAGVGLREAPSGGIIGRTQVAITAVTPMGMELRVTGGAAAREERPLVTYVAWPDQDGGSDG